MCSRAGSRKADRGDERRQRRRDRSAQVRIDESRRCLARHKPDRALAPAATAAAASSTA